MSAHPAPLSGVAGPNGANMPRPPGRHLVQLDQAEAMALLAGVEYGRVVFTDRALPAIRPVNHVIDGGDVIIRTRLAAAVSQTVAGRTGTVVAYQADQIDPARRLGWSVVVTGYANPVVEPEEIARLERALTPWVDMTMDTIIRIHPEIISGFRLVEP
jgi:nitroimidazol reductase NimA-like FMN-containing flavoprotein (pyridoxamine 5'-phosphate oxidase superfamily)